MLEDNIIISHRLYTFLYIPHIVLSRQIRHLAVKCQMYVLSMNMYGVCISLQKINDKKRNKKLNSLRSRIKHFSIVKQGSMSKIILK